MFKKMIGAVALATAIATSSHAIAQDIKIAFITHGQAADPFWTVVKNGAEAAGKDMHVDVDYRSPETYNMVQMASLINAAVNQEPDGLVVSVPDAEALKTPIENAVKAGIPVITINAGENVSKQYGALLHIGQGEYDAGKKAGEKLKELGGKKGLCVNHEVGNVSLDRRCAGFADGFGKDSVSVLPTTTDPADIRGKLRAALEKDSSIDTVLSLNASLTGEGAVAVAKDLGLTGKLHIGAFDLSANYLKDVSEGRADFAIDQQQYLQGYLPVTFLALYARYGLIPSGNVNSGPNLITKDKAAMAIKLASEGIR